MSAVQSIILGITQGLTEFLPISSSGHLIIIPRLIGWKGHSLAFDVMLHFATFCAIIIYFRREWMEIFRDGFLSIREKRLMASEKRRLFWGIVIATIPAAIFGSMVAEEAEYYFRIPLLVALMLGIFGIVLFISEVYGGKNKSLKDITWQIALLIGLAQMFAIIPGVSRSGVTISAALALGMNRDSSVRFSFLLGAPIIFAACCYSIGGLVLRSLGEGGLAEINNLIPWEVLLAGFTASFLTSIIAIHFLLGYIRRHSFTVFAIYRLAIAVVIVVVLLWRG